MNLIRKNTKINILFLILLPIIAVLLSLLFGRYSLSFREIVQLLGSMIKGNMDQINEAHFKVVFTLRLPRILLAIICGAGLSVSGTAFQATFGNPLVTPDIIGVASGAACGAVVALLFNSNPIWVQAVALAFGLLAMGATWMLSKTGRNNSIIMMVLSGIMISSVFQALISLVKYVADPEEQLQTITYWLMGSLSGSSYDTILRGAPMIIVGIIVLFMLRWKLNVLSLNEDEAKSMGINLKLMRIVVILFATLITAAAVSMCGLIGWIGLLIPHIARMIYGNNNQKIIPASISFGAVFLLIVDNVSRSLSAAQIPISILIAIIGAPLFILLLRQTGGKWT
jgi:iron complex transport system permease protein